MCWIISQVLGKHCFFSSRTAETACATYQRSICLPVSFCTSHTYRHFWRRNCYPAEIMVWCSAVSVTARVHHSSPVFSFVKSGYEWIQARVSRFWSLHLLCHSMNIEKRMCLALLNNATSERKEIYSWGLSVYLPLEVRHIEELIFARCNFSLK